MNTVDFRALVLAKEINLNTLAEHFGMNKKFRWEDPLVLTGRNLTGIINDPKEKYVYIFYFGSGVFINFSHHEIMDVVKYLEALEKNINARNPFLYQDDFMLTIRPGVTQAVNFTEMVTDSFKDFYLEIISIVLAKSVALENIESDTDKLLDDIEDIVDLLQRGNFSLSDRRLAKTSAMILRFKYNSLSYLMLLDKPDITWVNEDAGILFDELSEIFELEERYQTLRHKSEILMDITQVFTSLTHSSRDARLEWMIIILIAFEIILSLIDRFI